MYKHTHTPMQRARGLVDGGRHGDAGEVLADHVLHQRPEAETFTQGARHGQACAYTLGLRLCEGDQDDICQ